MAREVERKVAVSLQMIRLTLDQIQQPGDVNKFESGVSLFVYDSTGVLLDWNDNDFILPDKIVEGQRLFSNSDGDFLVDLKDFGHFKILGAVYVHRSFALSNEYLFDRYNSAIVTGNLELTNDPNSIPVKYQGETLFNIKCTGASYFDENVNYFITFLLAVLAFTLVLLIYQLAVRFHQRWGFKRALVLLIGLLLLLRAITLLVELPTSFSKLVIFQKDLFSEGWFYLTLGDGLLNLLLLNIAIVFIVLRRPKREMVKASPWFSLVLNVLTYLLIFWFAVTVRLLHQQSNLSLDVSTSLDISIERATAFLVVILLTGLFFLVHFLAYSITIRTYDRAKIGFFQVLLCSSMLLLGWLLDKPWGLAMVNGGYLLTLYYLRMPETLTSLKFSSVNYLLFTCIVMAVLGAQVIYRSQERMDQYAMQRFVSYLQVDRDIEGEYLLSGILDQIESDRDLRHDLKEGGKSFEKIANRLKRNYLSNYFSDYETEVYFFDKTGTGLSYKFQGAALDSLLDFYHQRQFRTPYSGIFYDGRIDKNKRKKYLCFAHIHDAHGSYGYIFFELTLKKFSSKRVLPQLMVERHVFQKDAFAFAHWVDGELNYTSGDYEYESAFDPEWLNIDRLYTQGIERNGYIHLGAKLDDKITLVSNKVYPEGNIVTNFSFLFVIQVILFSWVGLIFAGRKNRGISDLYFSTKIMLYSVASFVVPLILVAIAVLATTISTNRHEIDTSNMKRASLLAENLDEPLIAFRSGLTNLDNLASEINKLASYSGMDVNLYNARGILLASSTPEIFDRNVLSPYLSFAAKKHLILDRKETLTAEEQVGNFHYRTSYVAVNSPDTGELLGVLASPYFGSKNHVKRQLLRVFANIINIFTFIFIVSIALAYWVITRLTKPIGEIAEKLHDTGFVDTNKPLEWEADDEIGKLVQEYNNMLSKLDQSKVELAQNEKEAAWREMAKQVAHEIKNPLTPMKLTIQHLTRLLSNDTKNKKSLEVLLNQIDTLDEIVTSFSHFAKMPIPLNEPFDIRKTLQKSIDLHVDKNIKADIGDQQCFVNGDQKLFGRVFNNLILNAFEAMKAVKFPELKVELKRDEKELTLIFKDNGPGIPEEIKDKVFVPNFSTKAAGSGIGLAVARRGIEHAGGQIWFESIPGKGATFYIKLQVCDEVAMARN